MQAAPVRVLLVEDSASDALLLQESLIEAQLGAFEITRADRWSDAAQHLRQERLDVLLLDLTLPDSVGDDTLRRARNEAARLPVVVLTGATDDSIALDAVRKGVQDYLVKGEADGRQTARAIHYAIERKRVEETLLQTEVALRESGPDSARLIGCSIASIAFLHAPIDTPFQLLQCVPSINRNFFLARVWEERHFMRTLPSRYLISNQIEF